MNCGLVGYAGSRVADPRTLGIAFSMASHKGRYGLGWCEVDPDNAVTRVDVSGRPTSRYVVYPYRLIGCARSGVLPQPDYRAGFALVSDGWVFGDLSLGESIERQDTGALIRDVARGIGDVDHRDEYAVLALGMDGTLVAARMGLPLYTTSRPEGTYVTSAALGPDSELLPDVEPHLIGGPVCPT